mgnify:CR=1 FL=1
MKKLLLTALIGLTSFTYANINAVVSILPQQTFLEKIGGDKVNIALMVKPGNSPHIYEPKPSQMRNISKADVYFTIGVDFEDVWLKKFQNLNNSMIIKDMSQNITKIDMVEHSHHDEKNHEQEDHDDHSKHEHKEEKHHDEHDDHAKHKHDEEKHHDDHAKHEHDEHHHEGKDPHVWTSPENVKIIATNIYKQLSVLDEKNEPYYKKNLNTFLKEIEETDNKIKNLLKDTPDHTKFMVFHPAWGYFAKTYHLEQIAIESGGKNPKPKQIAHLIDEAKEENVKAVFTAPEFSTKAAKQIAKEVGVPVVKISPLSPEWSKNLIELAKAISN